MPLLLHARVLIGLKRIVFRSSAGRRLRLLDAPVCPLLLFGRSGDLGRLTDTRASPTPISCCCLCSLPRWLSTPSIRCPRELTRHRHGYHQGWGYHLIYTTGTPMLSSARCLLYFNKPRPQGTIYVTILRIHVDGGANVVEADGCATNIPGLHEQVGPPEPEGKIHVARRCFLSTVIKLYHKDKIWKEDGWKNDYAVD
jgi:hypothetical protein